MFLNVKELISEPLKDLIFAIVNDNNFKTI